MHCLVGRTTPLDRTTLTCFFPAVTHFMHRTTFPLSPVSLLFNAPVYLSLHLSAHTTLGNKTGSFWLQNCTLKTLWHFHLVHEDMTPRSLIFLCRSTWGWTYTPVTPPPEGWEHNRGQFRWKTRMTARGPFQFVIVWLFHFSEDDQKTPVHFTVDVDINEP